MNLEFLIFEKDLKIIIDSNRLSKLSRKKILITGASGLIGSYLTKTILHAQLAAGVPPSHFTLLLRHHNDTYSNHFYDKYLNVVDLPEIEAFVPQEQFDIVIHAASPASPAKFRSDTELQKINTMPIENLTRYQKNLETFLFFSAGEVYSYLESNNSNSNSKFDFSNLQRSMYPRAKMAGEAMLLEISEHSEFSPKIVRLFHTFGPGIRENDGRSISDFFWQVAQGQPPQLYSTGLSKRTFLYAADMANALLTILTEPELVGVVDLGSSKLITIKEFAETIAVAAGLSKELLNFQRKVDFESSPIESIMPNLTSLKSYNWREQYSLNDGVEQTLMWVNEVMKRRGLK